MNPAKLPNESFGAKTGHLDGTTALAVGLHPQDLLEDWRTHCLV